MRILILGATGMLGHILFIEFSKRNNLDVHGTVRSLEGLSRWCPQDFLGKVHGKVDADNFDSISHPLADIKPDVVINCIGIIKQLPAAQDPSISIAINALFPHKLAQACKVVGARMIHISTDCVFDGSKGNYTENDHANAADLYGRSKLLGEVVDPHCITLRSSIIGHELKGKHGLIEWFLAQDGKVHGYTNSIYSGSPTIEMARIIADYVIPNKDFTGLYHVSSAPISKYDLLTLVARRYGKQTEIERYDNSYCNRSLDSERFQRATGYNPPLWPDLVNNMYEDFISSPYYSDSKRLMQGSQSHSKHVKGGI